MTTHPLSEFKYTNPDHVMYAWDLFHTIYIYTKVKKEVAEQVANEVAENIALKYGNFLHSSGPNNDYTAVMRYYLNGTTNNKEAGLRTKVLDKAAREALQNALINIGREKTKSEYNVIKNNWFKNFTSTPNEISQETLKDHQFKDMYGEDITFVDHFVGGPEVTNASAEERRNLTKGEALVNIMYCNSTDTYIVLCRDSVNDMNLARLTMKVLTDPAKFIQGCIQNSGRQFSEYVGLAGKNDPTLKVLGQTHNQTRNSGNEDDVRFWQDVYETYMLYGSGEEIKSAKGCRKKIPIIADNIMNRIVAYDLNLGKRKYGNSTGNIPKAIPKFDGKVLMIGYSLGGVLANMIGYYFKTKSRVSNFKNNNNMSIVTFGAPRAGNAIFAQRMNEFYNNENTNIPQIYRYVNENDYAPGIPSVQAKFVHSGIQLELNHITSGTIEPTRMESGEIFLESNYPETMIEGKTISYESVLPETANKVFGLLVGTPSIGLSNSPPKNGATQTIKTLRKSKTHSRVNYSLRLIHLSNEAKKFCWSSTGFRVGGKKEGKTCAEERNNNRKLKLSKRKTESEQRQTRSTAK